MNSFWTLENREIKVDYLFSKNQFLLLLISLVLIIFLSMYTSRQSFKFQKVFLIICSILMIIFEGLRIFWQYKYLEYNNQVINFVSLTDLNFFTIALWLSILFLIITCMMKYRQNSKNFCAQFIFTVAVPIAIISMIYPSGINNNFEFYHCYNLLYIILRSLVITVGLVLVFSRWIHVSDLKDLWKGIISLALFAILTILIASFLNNGTNLLYYEYCPLFENVGVYLPAPLHYVLLIMLIVVFQYFMFLPFRFVKKFK